MEVTDYQTNNCNSNISKTCCTDQQFIKISLKMKIKEKEIQFLRLGMSLVINYLNVVSSEEFESILELVDQNFLDQSGFSKQQLRELKTQIEESESEILDNHDIFYGALIRFKHAAICAICDASNISSSEQIVYRHNFVNKFYFDEAQCPVMLKTVLLSKKYELQAQKYKLFLLASVFGNAIDSDIDVSNYFQIFDKLAESKSKLEKCVQDQEEGIASQACKLLCQNNPFFYGDFKGPGTIDIFYSEGTLNHYLQKKQKLLEKTEKIAKINNQIEEFKAMDKKMTVSHSICFFERKLKNGLDYCSATVLLELGSGIDLPGYLASGDQIKSFHDKKMVDFWNSSGVFITRLIKYTWMIVFLII